MPHASHTRGARYYSVDLHLHTPASHDYEDKQLTAKDFVDAAIAKDLEVIAVTDHNSAEWVDAVRAAVKKTSLIVFPGVEVSTPHCHILAIFDRDVPKSRIDDFLTTIGITTADRGKREANSKSLEDVLTEIQRFDGIALAPHANSTNGLFKQGTGQYKIKLAGDPRLSALEFTQKNHVEDFRQGKIPQYKPKACLQGSDAHSLAEIGQRRTFLKMDMPSLWSLRQACADHEIRIRYTWNLPEDRHPRVLSLHASQGFFAGTRFEFHPALNCIVGGRGTGKSTAIELMRFCFDDISSIEDIANDHSTKVSALLGEGGRVSVRYLDSDGEIKIVERELQEWDTTRTVKTEAGAEAELLASPVFFSQGELTRIASEPMAQLDLIDRYIDVEWEEKEETRIIRELKANAAQLAKLREQVSSIDEEVTDKDVGLEATRRKYKDLEKTLGDPALRDFPLWESESRYIEIAEEQVESLNNEIGELLDGLNVEDRINAPDPKTPSKAILNDIPQLFRNIAKDITSLKARALSMLASRSQELTKVKSKWHPGFAARKSAYEAALSKAGADDIKKAQAQLRTLKRRLDELERNAKGQAATLKQLQQLEVRRGTLRQELSERRASRFAKREAKVADWNKRFRGRIRLSITAGGDRSQYFEVLRVLSKGAILRDPDLHAISSKCSPERVRELVELGDHSVLASESGIKPENARKFVEVVSTKTAVELLNLEAVALPDVPDICYEAQPGTVRPLGQLSVGQKATVIISLALVEGDLPLVIDQPEEPLDTLAITDPVVDTLRGQKECRQFIFTTHNPNVAVGADAELNVVLEAGADRGTIRAAGGVDDKDTNKLLVLHLEGGPQAIERTLPAKIAETLSLSEITVQGGEVQGP